jgi:outer membrane protein assembly factor BamE (lipoprotein component of BamABCDE complex)
MKGHVRTIGRIVAVSVIASVAACASSGNQFLKDADSSKVDGLVVDGKSKKADVKAAFGDPNDTSYTDSGNEIWKYVYAKATATAASFIPIVGIFAGGADVDKKELVIFFDKDGTVVRHSLTFSKEEVKRGG